MHKDNKQIFFITTIYKKGKKCIEKSYDNIRKSHPFQINNIKS